MKYHLFQKKCKTLAELKLEANNQKYRIRQEILETNKSIFLMSAEDSSQLSISRKELLLFKNNIDDLIDDFHIIAYVRPPMSWMISAYQQRVVSGTEFELDIFKLYPRFKERLAKFELVFGKSNVSYNCFSRKSLYKGDVVADFINKLELDNDIDNKASKENTSIGLNKLSLLIFYRKFLTDKEQPIYQTKRKSINYFIFEIYPLELNINFRRSFKHT